MMIADIDAKVRDYETRPYLHRLRPGHKVVGRTFPGGTLREAEALEA